MLYTTDVACSLLNTFINALSQAEFQKCLALLLVLFSVIPTINVFGDSFGTMVDIVYYGSLFFTALLHM